MVVVNANTFLSIIPEKLKLLLQFLSVTHPSASSRNQLNQQKDSLIYKGFGLGFTGCSKDMTKRGKKRALLLATLYFICKRDLAYFYLI